MVKKHRIIACDGTETKSRHPKVYLNADKTGKVTCPYCYKVLTISDTKSTTE